MTEFYFLLIMGALLLLGLVFLILLLVKLHRMELRLTEMDEARLEEREGLLESLEANSERSARRFLDITSERQDATRRAVNDLSGMLEKRLSGFSQENSRRLEEIRQGVEKRLSASSMENEQKLENIRLTMERKVSSMQEDNNKRLDEMRQIVDEKLQKTINERMTESFRLVNERLEQVYKGLGEMQSLAVGVGDLKKTLSGVKTRGILGEIQLGAILREILTPEQYVTNFMVNKKPVEFAVKLPGDGGEAVYLPIDSKFPLDAYHSLMEAYESGSAENIKAASAVLKSRVQSFAKDIHTKYIDPPYTTEFAIMFLPTESLYAEVVRMGMLESLQREYRISIAGPSTMAAILNSFQMGFRSIAIQKHSGEVWKVLGAVKTEFGKFQEVLTKAQEKLNRVNEDLDALITTRTRKIQRRLKEVEALPYEETEQYFPKALEEMYEED